MRKVLATFFAVGFFVAAPSRADTNSVDSAAIVAKLQQIYVLLQALGNDGAGVITFPVGGEYDELYNLVHNGLFSPIGMGSDPYLVSLLWYMYGSLPNSASLGTVGEDAVIPALRRINAALTNDSAVLQTIGDDVSNMRTDLGNIQTDVSLIQTDAASVDSTLEDIYNILDSWDVGDLDDLVSGVQSIDISTASMLQYIATVGDAVNSTIRDNQQHAYLDGMNSGVLGSIQRAIYDALYEITPVWEQGDSAQTQESIYELLDEMLDYVLQVYELNRDLNTTVESIADYTHDIHYDDFNYVNTGRSVQSDFLTLLRMFGFTNPDGTNNLAHALSRFFDDSSERHEAFASNAAIASEVSHALRDLNYDYNTVSNTMESASSAEPDFGSGSVSNPFSPIGTAMQDFKTSVEEKLPDFTQYSGNEVVEIFRADTGLPMDAAGVVRVNLREEMGSWVNTCGNVMSWFWGIVNSVLTITLIAKGFREIGDAI